MTHPILAQYIDGDPDSWITELEEERKGKVLLFDTSALRTSLRGLILGQDAGMERILCSIDGAMLRQGRRRALAVALILGKQGIGKTEFFERLAELMGLPFFKIDCANLAGGDHALTPYLGNPKGLVGGQDIGSIPDFIAKNPGGGVIVFDEIEKALPSPDAPIAKSLMHLCEKGELLSRGDGKFYKAYNFIIGITSNLRKAEVTNELLTEIAENGPFLDGSDNPDWARIEAHTSRIRDIIRSDGQVSGFSDELLTRFTDIVVFEPLKERSISIIATQGIVKTLAAAGLTLAPNGIRSALPKEIARRSLSMKDPNGRDTIKVAERLFASSLRLFLQDLRVARINPESITVRVDLSPEGDVAIIERA